MINIGDIFFFRFSEKKGVPGSREYQKRDSHGARNTGEK